MTALIVKLQVSTQIHIGLVTDSYARFKSLRRTFHRAYECTNFSYYTQGGIVAQLLK